MQAIPDLVPIILLLGIYCAARVLDWLVCQIFRTGIPLAIFRAPGVIAHEFSHTVACKITGAEIREITWYNRADGSGKVVHGAPKIPVIGNFVISVAPFFGIILFLFIIGYFFSSFLGISVVQPLTDSASFESIVSVIAASIQIFSENILENPNPWFLVYLYLVISVLPGLAPSVPDLWNRDVLIIALLIIAILVAVMYYQIMALQEIAIQIFSITTPLFLSVMVCECIPLLILVPVFLLLRSIRS